MRRFAGTVLAVSALTTVTLGTALAQSKPAPPPPYLMKDMDASVVSVTWEAEVIDALLPDGLTPVEGYTRRHQSLKRAQRLWFGAL